MDIKSAMDDPMDRTVLLYTPCQISLGDEIATAFLYSPHATGRALKSWLTRETMHV